MLRAAVRTMTSTTPKRVQIPPNGVDYRGKVVLAPMVRSGELPSRLLALKYGADLVWGPETIDRAIIGSIIRHNPRASTIEFTRVPSHGGRDPSTAPALTAAEESIIYRIHPTRESSRLIFQLGTASPAYAVAAATHVAPYVAGVDVNAGCPKPFSTSGGMGAALLSTPELLCEILSALVAEVGSRFGIGISVKIRLLPEAEETRRLVGRLCETGITGLTVHCRTRAMRKNESAVREQLRMVGETCREAGVACLMNGDVEDRRQAEELAKEYGVDGAMIATAAEKNLSVFRREEEGGTAGWREVVKGYMEEALSVENRWGNTKFLLAQLLPGKELAKRNIAQVKNNEHACRVLELGDEMVERARALDALLGMTDRETKSEQKKKKRDAFEAEATAKRRKSLQRDSPPIQLQAEKTKQIDFAMDFQREAGPPAALRA